MPDLARLNPKQRENYHYMADAMRRLEWDLHNAIAGTGRIPPEWHEIARTRGDRPKVRISFWVEEDVLRFFKSMGRGHTTRMAEVLRSYMHARLAGVIRGADTISYHKRREGLHDGA
ncbi:MAG TPA: BrnA antitoxin family protein, partial [Paracoccaceae bacterium]